MRLRFLPVICVLNLCVQSQGDYTRADIEEIRNTVRTWSNEISHELTTLTLLTRREKTKQVNMRHKPITINKSFANANVIEEKWEIIVENVANNIRDMMRQKEDAVRAIKNHAEALAFHRKPDIRQYSGYDFYNANNITNHSCEDRSADRLEAERIWQCSIPENIPNLCFNTKYPSNEDVESYDSLNLEYDSFNFRKTPKEDIHDNTKFWPRCDHVAFLKRYKDYYRNMSMRYNAQFDAEVNLNYSIVRITPSAYARSDPALNMIRWSEGLDLTFKCNYQKDTTLTYQFFGSPTGVMRFYPAMNWSGEDYDQTFDFRLRSWYIEGISSAKDIIILLDRSGSMKGIRRAIATQIVNAILDTLTDNDYVNIYTFTNTTEPLVNCFNDTLVQANEENLRLLREQLGDIKEQFCGDITLGFEKAFPILWKYREARRGAIVCNQAIMLVTEGLDYEYNDFFKIYNQIPSEKYYRPIRVFTYLLGTEMADAQRMKWIACENMGYFANISKIEEVREKVLKYLEVMSRPINLSPEVEAEPAWTALYVHLVDRRLSNWLWKKYEGNRQRDIYIAYAKDDIKRKNKKLEKNQAHFTRETEHPFKMYLEERDYKYLTSVSLPVYDRRKNQSELLGVAGVDVPLDYIKQLTQPHRIGVNGYAFIITNNGYVLYHPDHRSEFKDKILKPTFNRVDFTEVELSDATIVPRQFDDAIIELRENIVLQKKGLRELKVRIPIDGMRRVILGSRHYFYTKISPFSLAIALPDRYGFLVIRHPKSEDEKYDNDIFKEVINKLKKTKHWKVNPNWLYTCRTHRAHKSPENELLGFLVRANKPPKNCSDLIDALVKDAKATEWYDNEIPFQKSMKSPLLEGVVMTFLATHAGLTRWKDLVDDDVLQQNHFAYTQNKATEEVYYRRSAEINYDNPDRFVYSVPFLTDGDYDENTTLITASNVVFQERGNKKAPVAAVGFQIYHKTVNQILGLLRCKGNRHCKISCVDSTWACYVLDNDGYIVLANDTEYVGKSLADVDKTLIDYLVKDGVYEEVTVFDYQGTCYPDAPAKDENFYGPTRQDVRGQAVCNEKELKDSPLKCKTMEFLRRQVQKTTPTPCDIELKMYNSVWKRHSRVTATKNILDCNCHYISEPIKGTNLMLIVVNGTCCHFEGNFEHVNEYPKEIMYNLTLPCYIATMNNFTKRHYMKCITKNEREFGLNADHTYCGAKEVVPVA